MYDLGGSAGSATKLDVGVTYSVTSSGADLGGWFTFWAEFDTTYTIIVTTQDSALSTALGVLDAETTAFAPTGVNWPAGADSYAGVGAAQVAAYDDVYADYYTRVTVETAGSDNPLTRFYSASDLEGWFTSVVWAFEPYWGARTIDEDKSYKYQVTVVEGDGTDFDGDGRPDDGTGDDTPTGRGIDYADMTQAELQAIKKPKEIAAYVESEVLDSSDMREAGVRVKQPDDDEIVITTPHFDMDDDALADGDLKYVYWKSNYRPKTDDGDKADPAEGEGLPSLWDRLKSALKDATFIAIQKKLVDKGYTGLAGQFGNAWQVKALQDNLEDKFISPGLSILDGVADENGELTEYEDISELEGAVDNLRTNVATFLTDSIPVVGGFLSELVISARHSDFSYELAFNAANIGRGDSHSNRVILGSLAGTYNGRGGIDWLIGGTGRDTLSGGKDDDWLIGGDGGDLLDGGRGADEILAGDGRDTVTGGAGADMIRGGDGGDSLTGGSGPDRIFGDAGKDDIAGGKGNDRLVGGGDDDEIGGGAGRDTLRGGSGADKLDGGARADNLRGDAGNDLLRGGEGDDKLQGASGRDKLVGESGDDRLSGDSGNDTLLGNGGDDVLVGGKGKDRLIGGKGDDQISGGGGADRLFGNGGSDTLTGGSGDDILLGGASADRLISDGGADVVKGGGGADTLVWIQSADGAGTVLDGGAGADYALAIVDANLASDYTFHREYGEFTKELAKAQDGDNVVFDALGLTVRNVETFELVYADSDLPATTAGDDSNVLDAATTRRVTGNVLINDVGPGALDKRVVTAVGVDADAVGTAANGWTSGRYGYFVIKADGSYTYKLTADDDLVTSLPEGVSVTDRIKYTVTAGGESATATLSVGIAGENDAPTMADGAIALGEAYWGKSLPLYNLGADVDRDNDGASLTYTILSGPETGTAEITRYSTTEISGHYRASALTFNTGGAFDGLTEGETHREVIVVEATDRHGATAKGKVVVTITGTNGTPELEDAALSLNEDDAPVTLDLTALASDDEDDGADMSYALVWAADTATIKDGVLTYYPTTLQYLAAGQTRSQGLQVVVTDSAGATATARVSVTVTGANDAPEIENGAFAARADAEATFDLTALASDADQGDTLVFSLSATATAGVARVDADGLLHYDPFGYLDDLEAGETRDVTVGVRVTDVAGESDLATITIAVTGVDTPLYDL